MLGTSDAQALTLMTNNVQRIQISTAGLIGIGTSVGNSLVSFPGSTTSRASINIAPGAQPATGTQGDLYVQGGNLFFHNGAQWENLRNYWRLNGTDLYYSGGEVGIDTASPVEKLEVQEGNIRINTASASDTTRRSIQWFDGLARWSIGYTASETNRPLRIQTGNTAVLSIQENGNVGIGVNSPGRTLDVNGAVRLQPTTLPSNPASGDLFNDGSSLFFYDGTSWSDLAEGGSGSGLWSMNGSDIYYSTGSVGVGVNNPAALFSVGTNSAFQVSSNGNMSTTGSIRSGTLALGGILKAAATTGQIELAVPGVDYEQSITFFNGITRGINNSVGLGGTLADHTAIALGTNTLSFTGTSGRVGFGTSSPARMVDINGAMRLRSTTQPTSPSAGDIYSSGSDIWFYNGSAWTSMLYGSGASLLSGDADLAYLTSLTSDFALGGSTSAAPFFFDQSTNLLTLTNTTTGPSFRVNDQSSDTSPFLIDADGRVAIGKTSASYKVDVVGDIYSSQYLRGEQGVCIGSDCRTSWSTVGFPTGQNGSTIYHNGTDWQASTFLFNGGNVLGVGISAPGALIDIAGATTARASMRIRSGTAPSSPNPGDLWFDGTQLIFQRDASSPVNLLAQNALWGENGSKIFYNLGEVGIGTSDPSSQLHVNSSTASSTGITVQNTSGSGNPFLRIQSAANRGANLFLSCNNVEIGQLTVASNNGFFNIVALNNTGINLQTGGTSSLLITNSGNVGLNTTGPNTTLDVNGAFSMRGMAAPANAPTGQGRLYFDSTTRKFRVSEDGNTYVDLLSAGSSSFDLGGNSFGALATLGTNDNFNLALETNNSTRMTITTSGNVGIGTTNPGQRLDVAGFVRSTSGGFIFPDGSIQTTAVGQGGGFWIGNGNHIYNSNTGNVGIGIINPTFKLDVTGNARFTSSVEVGGNLDFSSTNPILRAFNATNNNMRSVLELTADQTARNYFQMRATEGEYTTPTLSTVGAWTHINLGLSPKGNGNVIITSNNLQFQNTAPRLMSLDSNSNMRGVLEMNAGTGARNWLRLSTVEGNFTTQSVEAVGEFSNLNLGLTPKGTGNVVISSNNLLFNNTAPVLMAFNATNGNHRSVLQLTADQTARNYFQMNATEGDYTTPTLSAIGAWSNINLGLTPKGAGNVVIGSNNLLFNNTAPILMAFNAINNNHRNVLQLTADQTARNYFQMNATEGSFTTPTISTIGAWDNINLGLSAKGGGRILLNNGSQVLSSGSYNTTSPGTAAGGLHIAPSTTTAGHSTALTFGASNHSNAGHAQAGIYVEGNTGGTTMRLATTNSYGSGAQTRMTIDTVGAVTFTGAVTSNGAISATGNLTSGGTTQLGGSTLTNGRLNLHGTSQNIAN